MNNNRKYGLIWKQMIDLNMNQKELINRTGLSRATISRMRAGKEISTRSLIRICRELGVSIDELITNDE